MSDGNAGFGNQGALPTTEAAPSIPPPSDLDLSSCDREPIHIPGSIQPNGFLLALDSHLRVAVASANAAQYLGQTLPSILGRTLPELLGPAHGSALLDGLGEGTLSTATRLLVRVELPGTATGMPQVPDRFDVVAHRPPGTGHDWTVVEFEHSTEPVDTEAVNVRLYNFVASIRSMASAQQVAEVAVTEIQALTGCDRVVLYRFDEAGHGLVLAEVLANPRFSSYLGLRFPASDVPVQARRMYLLNRVRIIPNVDYEPSPLLAANSGGADEEGTTPAPEIDLSSSILRSVSPIHRQYMRNMGTACSMSVSIIIEGKLWGLVSCHHHAPRYVPLRLRSACDFTMQVVASQIESQLQSAHLRRALEAKAVQGRLLASMAAEDSYMEGLTRSPALLQQLVEAGGAAVVTGAHALLLGTTPSEPEVVALTDWLCKRTPRKHPESSRIHPADEVTQELPADTARGSSDEIFATGHLVAHYPPASAFTAQASGLLAISVSKVHSSWVLWFRPEVVETVRWAGNPAKPGEAPQPSATLPAGIVHPRHSFQEWSELVQGTSDPWNPEDIDAAADFRAAVLEIVLRRAEELAQLANGLQVANEELEAFSYSVSHDLRAPFRHISGFSEMLKEEEATRMSERGRQYLATIMESASFAGQLVDSLLEFSRFARAALHVAPVNMEALVDDQWRAVLEDESRGRTIDFSRAALPRVMGDAQLLRQVLRNLFSNAVKYTGRQSAPRIRMEATRSAQEVVFSISDNGVGFDAQYAGKLFGVFQRLHRMEDFEGTGIGLANVRRIISRHGGRVWAEGAVGKGATFFFSLPVDMPAVHPTRESV